MSAHTSPSFKFGGKLRHHKEFWHTLCKDKTVLDLLNGITVDFVDHKPPFQQKFPRELKMDGKQSKFLDSHIATLLQSGCIEQCDPDPSGFMNNVFLVEKCEKGTFRMILNLREFNHSVKYTKFQLNQIDSVLKMIQCNDFFGSLDLIQAFAHAYVKKPYQKYFMFQRKGVTYHYITMPQGYKDSPRLFCRLMAPILSHLRSLFIDILCYIDDTFLHSCSSYQLQQNLDFTRQFFQQCGLTVNVEKSSLVPSQQMEFLGFLLDSVAYTVTVVHRKRVVIHKMASFIGKVVSLFPASNAAKLHYRTFDRFKVSQLRAGKKWTSKVILHLDCILEMKWWCQNIHSRQLFTRSLAHPKPTQFIYTDSSGYGYGAVWGVQKMQGLFSEKQKSLSINTKELLAIHYSLGAWASNLKNEIIHFKCDNICALYASQNLDQETNYVTT